MNRFVKIILAIAIGIMYPVLIFTLSLNLFPDIKPQPNSTNDNTFQNTFEECDAIRRVENAPKNNYKYNSDEYDNCIRVGGEKRDALVKAENALKNNVIINRINLALVSALIGFTLVIVLSSVSPLAAGMSGGSMMIIIISTGLALSVKSNGNLGPLPVALFTTCFAFLVVVLFMIDTKFPRLNKPEASKDMNNTAPYANQSPADSPQVSSSTTHELKETIIPPEKPEAK